MSKVKTIFVVSSVVLLLATAVTMVAAQGPASLVIGSQKLFQGDAVFVSSVTIGTRGFVAIFNDLGQLVGLSKVSAGTTNNLMIRLHMKDINRATAVLTAQLFEDVGVIGKFEPGVDVPVGDPVEFEIRGANQETAGPTVTSGIGVAATTTTATTAPAVLPPTGGAPMPWISLVLLAAGTLSLVAGIGMSVARRKR